MEKHYDVPAFAAPDVCPREVIITDDSLVKADQERALNS